MRFPQIDCSGSPYEVGFIHGSQAKTQIEGSIQFYKEMFYETAQLEWNIGVHNEARKFVEDCKWMDLLQEMKGIADGANVHLLDIVGLNIRTEIAFGLFKPKQDIPSDGCTSMAWIDVKNNKAILAQNWDWSEKQKDNLITLRIKVDSKPKFIMVTEAGIIGKIGCNEFGVGCCLNALKAYGVDTKKIPCHVALRIVLESKSAIEAIQTIESIGIASACNILIADCKTSQSLEASCKSINKIYLDPSTNCIFHTNNYIIKPDVIAQDSWLKDSPIRLDRIQQLSKGQDISTNNNNIDSVCGLFKDEFNFPYGICRSDQSKGIVTLFGIIMDLSSGKVQITYGRPSNPDGIDIIFV